jgi:hypothetical protein
LFGLHNPQLTVPRVLHCKHQRVDIGGGGTPRPGSGNGEAAAAGAAAVSVVGFFTGFGRIGLVLFGGVAGCNSAITGLGSTLLVAEWRRSPGIRMTWTGTVAGWNFASV